MLILMQQHFLFRDDHCHSHDDNGQDIMNNSSSSASTSSTTSSSSSISCCCFLPIIKILVTRLCRTAFKLWNPRINNNWRTLSWRRLRYNTTWPDVPFFQRRQWKWNVPRWRIFAGTVLHSPCETELNLPHTLMWETSVHAPERKRETG